MNSRNEADTTSQDIQAPRIPAQHESQHSIAAFSQRHSSHPLHVDRSVSGPVKGADSHSGPTTSSIVTELRVNAAAPFDVSLGTAAYVHSMAHALEHGPCMGFRGALEHGGVL